MSLCIKRFLSTINVRISARGASVFNFLSRERDAKSNGGGGGGRGARGGAYLKGALISFLFFFFFLFLISFLKEFQPKHEMSLFQENTTFHIETQICVRCIYLNFDSNVLLLLTFVNPTNPFQVLNCSPQVSRGTY